MGAGGCKRTNKSTRAAEINRECLNDTPTAKVRSCVYFSTIEEDGPLISAGKANWRELATSADVRQTIERN